MVHMRKPNVEKYNEVLRLKNRSFNVWIAGAFSYIAAATSLFIIAGHEDYLSLHMIPDNWSSLTYIILSSFIVVFVLCGFILTKIGGETLDKCVKWLKRYDR